MEIFRRVSILKSQYLQNKDERLCKEHELEDVSSLILDYEAVRMSAGRLHLSREIIEDLEADA